MSNTTTPTIGGAATLLVGDTLAVTVNGVTYPAGGGDLVDNGNGTWSLSIPPAEALSDGVYEVVAVVTDAAGNSATDATTNELSIDTAESSD